MKNRKFFLYLLFSILFSQFSISAQNISSEIYTFLTKNKYSPSTQALVNSTENNFPYNITQTFSAEPSTSETLFLVFYQEDFLENKEIIQSAMEYVKNEQFDFNVTFLFLHGENQKLNKQGMIYGSQAFLSSIVLSEDYTAIIFELSKDKNIVISNSRGLITPSWLIINEFNIFLKHNYSENLPFYFLSQIYSYDFFEDRILYDFFKNDIPTIKLCFDKNQKDDDTISAIIQESIKSYSEIDTKKWDQHFLMIKFFGKYLRLSETGTIKIILSIILIWVIFIFLFIQVNNNAKHHAWQSIKKIWYIVPVTFAAIFLSFYEGQFIFYLFHFRFNDYKTVLLLFAVQIFAACFNISIIYYVTLIFNKNFESKTIDYLIILGCFINQSVFILVDISLFPIFMIICLLSILALIFIKKLLHILVLVLLIIPFIPYIHSILLFSDIHSLRNYLNNNINVYLTFTFILYPIMLTYFEILTSFQNKHTKKTHMLIGISIPTVIVFILLFSIALIRSSSLSKKHSGIEKKLIYTTNEELFTFNYSDRQSFSDIIRTIKIGFKESPVQCDITLTGENSSPILYTDNEFESITSNSVYFKIPYNPPEQIQFTYGTQQDYSTIKITATFEKENENEFILVSKTFDLGDRK